MEDSSTHRGLEWVGSKKGEGGKCNGLEGVEVRGQWGASVAQTFPAVARVMGSGTRVYYLTIILFVESPAAMDQFLNSLQETSQQSQAGSRVAAWFRGRSAASA